jgi:hypothetical protein
MYSNRPNISLLLKGYDGGPYTRDRSGKDEGEIHIANALLSLAIAVQSDVAVDFLNNKASEERGLVARMLCCWPAPMFGSRFLMNGSAKHEDHQAVERLEIRVNDLWSDLVLMDQPKRVVLDHFAQSLYGDWHDDLERSVNDLSARQRRAIPKLRGCVPRIAAILHLLVEDTSVVIPSETMRAAIMIGDYFLGHVTAIDEALEPLLVIQDARKIIEWLTANEIDRTTVREITRAVNFHRRKGGLDRTIAALHFLAARNWVAALDNRDGFGQGSRAYRKASPTVLVNPRALAQVQHTVGTPLARDSTVGTHSSGGRSRRIGKPHRTPSPEPVPTVPTSANDVLSACQPGANGDGIRRTPIEWPEPVVKQPASYEDLDL